MSGLIEHGTNPGVYGPRVRVHRPDMSSDQTRPHRGGDGKGSFNVAVNVGVADIWSLRVSASALTQVSIDVVAVSPVGKC